MTPDERSRWASWYGEKLGLGDKRKQRLLEMARYSTQTLMPECEFCNKKLRMVRPVDIPIFKRCGCYSATSEWVELERTRERKWEKQSMKEWANNRLKAAEENGEYPKFSAGAEWHGVKRGEAGVAAVDDVLAWVKEVSSGASNSSLYLHGPKGTGKTTLAGLCAQRAILAGVEARYVRWSGLLHDIKSSWTDKTSDPLQSLKNVGLLIVDDFGKDIGSQWVGSVAFELVDAREQKGLPTMFTSNHDIRLASMRLGTDMADAVEDRLNGSCKVVELFGKSHRQN